MSFSVSHYRTTNTRTRSGNETSFINNATRHNMIITEPLRLFTEVRIQLTPSGQLPNYKYKIVSVTLLSRELGGIDYSFWG